MCVCVEGGGDKGRRGGGFSVRKGGEVGFRVRKEGGREVECAR